MGSGNHGKPAQQLLNRGATMEATETKRKPERRNMRGQGSIIKRNGRFAGVLSLGKDASGKRLRRWIYGDTKTEVANELTRLKGQKLDGNLAGGSKTTVGAWLDLWLETVINGNRRESTYAAFKNSIETHI